MLQLSTPLSVPWSSICKQTSCNLFRPRRGGPRTVQYDAHTPPTCSHGPCGERCRAAAPSATGGWHAAVLSEGRRPGLDTSWLPTSCLPNQASVPRCEGALDTVMEDTGEKGRRDPGPQPKGKLPLKGFPLPWQEPSSPSQWRADDQTLTGGAQGAVMGLTQPTQAL